MNDFDFDVKQKEDISRSARKKIGGSQSRKCTLPHDGLSPAQLAALNGPVKSYKLGQPMDWATFNMMPEDMRRAYLRNLMTRFNPSQRELGSMFDISHTVVGSVLKQFGLSRGKDHRMTQGDREAWEKFLAGDTGDKVEEETPIQEESVEEPATNIAAESEDRIETETVLPIGEARPAIGFAKCVEKRVELTEVSHYAALTSGELNLRGTASEILSRLAVVFEAESDAQMFVSVKFSVGNGAES